jgi:hypothetical protein
MIGSNKKPKNRNRIAKIGLMEIIGSNNSSTDPTLKKISKIRKPLINCVPVVIIRRKTKNAKHSEQIKIYSDTVN